MTTLDRYIARQYFFNVCALLALLFTFVVAVDVALNLDRFLKGAAQMSPNADGLGRLTLAAIGVFDIWWPRLLQLYVFMIGLVLVAAMGFTFTQLARHRELVAVLSGGIPLYRLMWPVLCVALVMLALRAADQELVLSHPRVAPLLTRDPSDMGRRDWTEFPVQMVKDAEQRVWLARSFDPARGEMEGVTVWVRSGGQAQYAVHAASAVWRDGGWDLSGARVQSMQMGRGGTAEVGAGGGVPGAAPKRIETDLDPNALKARRFKVFSQSLSWRQIGEMLARPQSEDSALRGALQRARWSRVSQAVSVVLALFITMPFFLVREPRNMLVQSLKCAPVGIVALMGGVFLSTLEWGALPPGFAVFIPVLILIPAAIASVSMMRT